MKLSKVMSGIVAATITASSIFSYLATPVSASSTVTKSYPINAKNVTVYTDSALTKKGGTIFWDDEVRLGTIGSRSVVVTYDITGSKGKTKTLYAKTSDFLISTRGTTKYATQKTVTYKYPNTKYRYGSFNPGESVMDLGVYKGMHQIRYSLDSGGYKYAFITDADAKRLSTKKPGITVFSQLDNRWASVPYGKCNGKTAYISSSGCGILAYVNAVYYLTQRQIDVKSLAKWSVDHGYRINNTGTSHSLYKAYAAANGSKYGFAFVKTVKKLSDVRNNLINGDVAVIGVNNHLMALVAYNTSSQKYLVLDSYKSSKRGTASNGSRWMKASEFTGAMAISEIMVLKKK